MHVNFIKENIAFPSPKQQKPSRHLSHRFDISLNKTKGGLS